jgi:DNA polymerase-3 subunit delta'
LLSAWKSGRLPHAYLFYGGEGVGKDAMAIELARVLQCERGGEEACGVCTSCVRMSSLQHPDVRLVIALPVGKGEQSDDGPMARLTENEIRTVQDQLRAKGLDPYHQVTVPKANIIKINSIREVRRESSMSSFGGKKKIFIISHADMMGDEAANTLLKTLEEPTGECMLILTTAHRDALPATILSRCQNVRFDQLTEEEISGALVGRDGVPKEQASLLARLANGSYTNALRLMDVAVLEERKQVLAFIRHALAGNAATLSDEIDRLIELKDRDRVSRFLVLVMMWFRDALVLSLGRDVINVDQKEDITRFVARFPGANIRQVIADVEKAIALVERNVYLRLVLLQLAIQLKANIMGTR